MRRWLALLLTLGMLFALAACNGDPAGTGLHSDGSETGISQESPESTLTDEDTLEEEVQRPETPQQAQSAERRIQFLLDNGAEIVVLLQDNPAAEDLYDRLPLELTFEEFNGTEKIAYLSEELTTEGAPTSCDPDVGSLCYYIPWGNLCFFYQDFRPSQSLIPLGTVESGGEWLEQLDSVSSVRVQAVGA